MIPRTQKRIWGNVGGRSSGDRRRSSWRNVKAMAVRTLAADYKGEFMLSNRPYCYPLTITDFAGRDLIPRLQADGIGKSYCTAVSVCCGQRGQQRTYSRFKR